MAVRQNQRELHAYLGGLYGKVFRRYQQLLQDAVPGIPPLELFWRAQFMLGAAIFSMAGIQALRGIAQADFGTDTSTEQVLELMVPFLAAGMRSETVLVDPALIAARRRLADFPALARRSAAPSLTCPGLSNLRKNHGSPRYHPHSRGFPHPPA